MKSSETLSFLQQFQGSKMSRKWGLLVQFIDYSKKLYASIHIPIEMNRHGHHSLTTIHQECARKITSDKSFPLFLCSTKPTKGWQICCPLLPSRHQ